MIPDAFVDLLPSHSWALRSNRLAWAGVYIILAVAFCWPLLVRPDASGTGDWDQHTFYYASVLRSLAFGQLPFWNPWYCGGNVLWQNPQVALVSPVYPLALVMPLALAMRLNVLGHYLIGCAGMHFLVRRIVGVKSPAASVYLVSLFVFSGGMALHLAEGHTNFLSVFWLPGILYCFFRAAEGRTREPLVGALLVALMIVAGGLHVVPLTVVLLGILGVGGAAIGRVVRPLVVAVLMVAAGFVYAAPKLVPMVSFATSAELGDERRLDRPDVMSLEMFRRALWTAGQTMATPVNSSLQPYGWHEYGNYLGWFGASLALGAAVWILVFRRRREHWREVALAIALVGVLLLAAGHFAWFAPVTLLQHTPFFSSFRIPSRYILLVPLVGAACVAFLVRAWEADGRFAVRWWAGTVSIVAICQLAIVNRDAFHDVFRLPPVAFDAGAGAAPAPAVVEHASPGPVPGAYSDLMASMAAGVSALDCYDPLVVKRTAVPGVPMLSGIGDLEIRSSRFSPNRISAEIVAGAGAARLVLNQNFAHGWSSNAGAVRRDPEARRPSVLLPPKYTGTVTFTFVPPGLGLGVLVCAAATAVSLYVWRSARGTVAPVPRRTDSSGGIPRRARATSSTSRLARTPRP